MKKGVSQQLNLAYAEAALPQVLERARAEQWTYETFLQRVWASELDGREQKAMARRLKSAHIPAKKTLDGFEFAFQPSLSERRLRELADLSFVRTCTNVIFLGPAGTGQTHLSLALADRALVAGHSVLFTTLAELAQALESASHPGLLRQRLRRYIVPSLLVKDSVGYPKLSPEQARHFFELVTARVRAWVNHSDLQYQLCWVGKPARRRSFGYGPAGPTASSCGGDPDQWTQVSHERAPGELSSPTGSSSDCHRRSSHWRVVNRRFAHRH
jgi:DNA replication protein DnaC